MRASWTIGIERLDGIVRLRAALEANERASVSGLAGAARLLAALLATDRPLLVVVPRERDVETVAEDAQTLAGELGIAGDVLAFPAPGPAPFRSMPRHPEAALARAAALLAAGRGSLRAVVASPAGLLRPVLAPEHWEGRSVTLRVGDELSPRRLMAILDAAGYVREDPVGAPGQAAHRGFIVDMFPPDLAGPVRAEFVGDSIESLRLFDVDSQRSLAPAPSLDIRPLSDVLPPEGLRLELIRRLSETLGPRDAAVLVDRIERGVLPDDLGELLSLVEGALTPAWTYWSDAVAVAMDPESLADEAAAFHARTEDSRLADGGALLRHLGAAVLPPRRLAARLAGPSTIEMRDVDLGEGGISIQARPVRRYGGDIRSLVADIRAFPGRTVILLGGPGRAERLVELLREDGIAPSDDAGVVVRTGALRSGFELADPSLRVLADGDVFPEEVRLHKGRQRRRAGAFFSDFRDLKVGDLVVHEDHGVARFEGLETLEVSGVRMDFMVLSYQGGDKLKVPVDAFDRIQKYAAGEGARPALDRLGSGRWEGVKRRVKKAMRDMAQELLRLHAERKARPGHAFVSESPWQREFEESFEYDETPDQAQAIDDVAADMATPSPMDRLVCGDVGYGKTEVAMRAAMRAVLDDTQVAVLAPTTVLAFQHWKTFRRRFAPFPVVIEMVSRFRSHRDVKRALAAAKEGRVDILIGTHRLLSKDVAFRALGLLIVDEEQRFGVAAKERLKHLQRAVDCLTLSATPIPRTLQMALSGLRDMSVIETPPKDRLSIQTSILKFSKEALAAAIRQELGRDGQVFVVHNKVETIDSFGAMVQDLVPEARVAVAHGQMPEAELERRMLAFVEGRADVLVTTTIVENGLDIPRVNTILIDRAERYGLAQLYQLRGRVGRSDRRAYAYLLVSSDGALSEIARKRLAAIQEFSELGAGFRVAALDLELRGAGNLLGGEQSGHIEAVGLDLYIKLLEQTILELKGDAPAERPRCALNLKLDLRIPAEYMPDVQQRMSIYKRLSEARRAEDLGALEGEIRDRNGDPPESVRELFDYARLRQRAEALDVVQVDRGPGLLSLRFAPDAAIGPSRIVDLVRSVDGARLSPDGVLRVPCRDDALDDLDRTLAALGAAREPVGAR